MNRASTVASIAACAALSASGCSNPTYDFLSIPTGSECPTGSTLTYSNFGQSFFTTYCIGCHGHDDAEGGLNFSTLAVIRDDEQEIDGIAAAGPTSTNSEMPLSGTVPTDDQRRQLGEWLACNSPM